MARDACSMNTVQRTLFMQWPNTQYTEEKRSVQFELTVGYLAVSSSLLLQTVRSFLVKSAWRVHKNQ